MFNIGPLEILTILIVALVVVGPKRLPELARTIGRGLNEFRKIQDEVKDMVKFDLGADLTAEEEEPLPTYDLPDDDEHLEDDLGGAVVEEGPVADGMTHSERVIAALPDDDEAAAEADDDAEVAPLPAVTSATGGMVGSETPADDGDPAEPSAEPPAAAAE